MVEISTGSLNVTRLRMVQGASTSAKATASAAKVPTRVRHAGPAFQASGTPRIATSHNASPRVRVASPMSAPTSAARRQVGRLRYP